jgi:secreted PhoX family phosphatase
MPRQPREPETPTFGHIVERRYGRREVLKSAAAVGAVTVAGLRFADQPAAAETGASPASTTFTEVPHGVDEAHHVAPGYRADILIRWGDPVEAGAPAFEPSKQTAAAQAKQFGYNNDFLGFVPLSGSGDRGLLCVNHEYTDTPVMVPGGGLGADGKPTRETVEIEMAAHGGSVIEIEKTSGRWSVVAGSRYARRITALATEIDISGPAAGHARLKTSEDPSGRRVVGMVNNCAGGMTPWGTWLTCEENFDGYFMGDPGSHPEAANHKAYGIGRGRYAWGLYHRRFDVSVEPNEPNRFGWIVEIDPLDPASRPVKRTALGRRKHEGAETIINRDGRLVVYSGDDERFEHVYRFVTAGRVDRANRAANRDLLDAGVMSVARFETDGTLRWVPMVWGQGPLTAANGFASQADVLIEPRRAAKLLGATRMDRPEDVQPNPRTNKVYVALTNNESRKEGDVDPANDRAANMWGQIVEMIAPDGDHAADVFRWEMLVRCGPPGDATAKSTWNPATSPNGWFSCPDNLAVDGQGRLWVATDQGTAWKRASGTADGIWALETEGPKRGTGRMFYRVPVGAEMCGPCFAPDDRTLFVAVQHPGVDGAKDYAPFGKNATFEAPATRWPDFKPDMPVRPSVVAIVKEDGGVIGS